MSNKGYTVGTYIIKTEKKNSELPMCPICKKCKDRSLCKNRKDKKEGRLCAVAQPAFFAKHINNWSSEPILIRAAFLF